MVEMVAWGYQTYSRYSRDIQFIILLCSIVILFFSHILFTDTLFCFRDFYRVWYPVRLFTAQCIHTGLGLPLWNPYAFGGVPTVADMSFYPLSVITYLPDFNLSMKLFVIIHYLIACCGIYLLLRQLGISSSGTLIGSVSFVFGGYLLGIVDMLNTLSSASLMPFVFLLAYRYMTTPNMLNLILGTGIIAMFLLSGDVTVVYATIFVLFIYAIHLGIIRKHISPVFYLLLIILTGCGITLFKIVPTIEAIINSSRIQGVPFDTAAAWAFEPVQLIEWIVPLFHDVLEPTKFQFGQNWLLCSYFGVIPFIFLCIAIINRNQRRYIFFTFVFLISLILSFGDNTPLYYICYHILPGFSFFRFPVKFFCLVAFSGSILTGYGFDIMLKKGFNPLKYILIGIGGILLIVFILGNTYFYTIIRFIQEIYNISGEEYTSILITRIYNILTNMGIALIFIGPAILSFLTIRTRKLLICVLFLLIVADLFIAGWRYQPTMKEQYFTYQSDTLKLIKNDDNIFRVMLTPATCKYFSKIRCGKSLAENHIEYMKYIVPYLGLPYHIFYTDVAGYMALCPEEYKDVVSIIMTYPPVLQPIRELINLLNIKYIISREKLKPEFQQDNWILIYDKDIYIYRNNSVLPRAFFVPEAIYVPEDKILETMVTRGFGYTNKVILQDNIDDDIDKINKGVVDKSVDTHNLKAIVEITRYKLHKICIDINTPVDGWLVLTDNYYPGWEAYINDIPVKIYRAYHAFRAVEIKKGKHKVVFVYNPLSLQMGIYGSIVSLFLILIYLCIKTRK